MSIDNNTPSNLLEQQRREAKRFAILVISGAMLFGALIVAAVFMQAQGSAAPNFSDTGITEQEARSFYLSSCSTCHGPHGQGGGLLNAPPLNSTGQAWQYSDEQIVEFMQLGKGNMPGLGSNYNETLLQAVADYIKQWWTPEQLAQQPK